MKHFEWERSAFFGSRLFETLDVRSCSKSSSAGATKAIKLRKALGSKDRKKPSEFWWSCNCNMDVISVQVEVL